MKRKIQSQLKRAGIKTIPKKITQAINKKVGSIIRNPPQNIRSKIRKNITMEIKKAIAKRNSIQAGLTHKQVGRQAERAIYSGANF